MSEIIIGLAVGLVLAFPLVKGINKIVQWYKSKTRLIKSYWMFSILFIIISISGYFLIILSLDGNNESLGITLMNQTTALTSAIFVGYFAFAQVMENRKEKLDISGMKEMGNKQYKKAISYWELAHGINKKDTTTLENFIEAYLIGEKSKKAEEKLPLYEKLAVDGSLKVTI